jgi:YegS/Rv2252/BmrU family lipid kinase
VEATRGPRDGVRLARQAAQEGFQRLVVAGGDGTLSEVVTGLVEAGASAHVELGVLPLGTGGDFPRTLGIPRDLDLAIQAIATGAARPLDAGRVEFRDRDGRPASSCFVNVASLGISGRVVEIVNRALKVLPGQLAFLLGTLRALASYRRAHVALRLDGEAMFDGDLVLAAAANGRWFGGGMQVAPDAKPDDGVFDVVVVGGLSRTRLLARLPGLYRGTHVRDAAVQVRRGRVLEADAPGERVWLELDGEPLGTLPARIELLPGALRVVAAST